MKHTKILAFLLALAVVLSGCGSLLPAKPTETAEPTVTNPPAELLPAEDWTIPAVVPEERDAMLGAYQLILEHLTVDHVWPDGSHCDFDDAFGDIEDNTFAIADITGDGIEELIISYSTAPMAGMEALVLGYDTETDRVQELLQEFPALTVYEGGLIRADWAHNQGLSTNFWPYTLYYYNAEAGMYTLLATVDAWERDYKARDYDGNSFPGDVDTENAGIVYLINYGGRRDTISQSDYDAWEVETFAGHNAIFFNWMDLTLENIHAVANGSVG